MAFTYTDEQWVKVAAELPDSAPWVRVLLELRGSHYIAQVEAANGKPGRSFRRSQVAWQQVAGSVRQLQRDLETLGQHPLEFIYAFGRADSDQFRSFMESLPWFVDRAERMAERLQEWNATHKKRSNATDVERDHYIESLLHEWQAQGRKLRATNRNTGEISNAKAGTTRQEADGAVIRFLSAASGPVFDTCGVSIKPGALMHVMRKIRANGE